MIGGKCPKVTAVENHRYRATKHSRIEFINELYVLFVFLSLCKTSLRPFESKSYVLVMFYSAVSRIAGILTWLNKKKAVP